MKNTFLLCSLSNIFLEEQPCCFLGCIAVQFRESPSIQRSIWPPFSESNGKPNKKSGSLPSASVGFLSWPTYRSWKWRWYIPPKLRAVSERHRVTTQRARFHAVTTSDSTTYFSLYDQERFRYMLDTIFYRYLTFLLKQFSILHQAMIALFPCRWLNICGRWLWS
jgi:hypothetical protein